MKNQRKNYSFSYTAILQITSCMLYSTYISTIVPIIHIQVTSSNIEFFTINIYYTSSFILHSLEYIFTNYVMV